MSGPAARFDSDTEKLENVRSAEQGDYLHEYTGKLTETDTSVRILTIAPALAADDQAVDAFTQISDQWYNAGANANIVTVLEQDTDPRPWIALSRATGKTLRTVRSNLSPTAIETVVSETADALRTLGLYNTVHGHPSPSNIWVEESASDTAEPTVRLGGFGLEDAVRAAVGEPEPTAYTAPELLDDPGQSSEQTDVYGLGAVTYFALTGRPPVAGDDLAQAIADGPDSPPSEYVETLSSDVDDVVIQALSKRPDDRQESPYAFSRAFLSAFSPEQLGISDSTQEEPEDSQATSPSGQEAADTATTDGSNETTDSTRRVPPKLAIGVVGIGVLVIGGVALMTVLGGSIVGDSGDVPAEDADEDTESLLTEDANAVSAEESPSSGDGSVLDDGGSDSGAETPIEPSTPAGGDNSESSDTTPLSAVLSDDPLEEAREVDGTTYNGTSQATAVLRNDTSNNRELIEYTDESGTTSEVYTASDYVAYRNGATGEEQYGGPDSTVGGSVQFEAAFTAIGPLFYTDLVEWEQTGTTTVNGEDALVYEGDSLNQTAFDGGQFGAGQIEQSEVQSVDGRIVVGSNGRVYSTNVEIETQDGTYGGDMSVNYDDITVTQPGWVDESQAP